MDHAAHRYSFYTGFNRYMVECESHMFVADYKQLSVLIDTWWNVNTLLICFRTTLLLF